MQKKIHDFISSVRYKNPNEKEFLQAVEEVAETVLPFIEKNPKYKNVLFDIYDYFEDRIKDLRSFGINHNNIILDPGIGFGKNLKHNMILLKNILEQMVSGAR